MARIRWPARKVAVFTFGRPYVATARSYSNWHGFVAAVGWAVWCVFVAWNTMRHGAGYYTQQMLQPAIVPPLANDAVTLFTPCAVLARRSGYKS